MSPMALISTSQKSRKPSSSKTLPLQQISKIWCKSCHCFIPEKYNFYPQLWFCPVPFIPVYKAFLPGQDSTKIREMLNSEFCHPCKGCVLPLLGNLTFLLHSSDNSDIIVDLNSCCFLSFLSPGDSFCWEQLLLLFHHHSPAELRPRLGWAVHPLIMLMLSSGRFLFKIF